MPDAPSPKPQDRAERLDGAKALFLTQYYRPELIGSGPFCGELAEWLAAQGCRVTVVAGPPHYPQPDLFRVARETLPEREIANGVKVERLRSRVPITRGARHRIASDASFAIQAVLALLLGRIRRVPLVLTLCPSILTVALGSLFRARGGRHVAVVHDIPSGLAKGVGLVESPLLHRLMQFLERSLLNRADLVVVLTQSMKQELRRLGVVSEIEVAPIWVDLDRIGPAPSRPAGARLLYSGSLGRKQGLEQIVTLAQVLASTRPEIEIVVRGEGSERASLQKRVADLGLGNVHFDALLPAENLSAGLADGDVHIVPQDPAAADFAIPSKIFSIMAAGRTFIATANPGSPLWRLRRLAGAFLTVPANDHALLARAAVKLLDNVALRDTLGRRGRKFVEENCAREKVLGDLVPFLFNEGWESARGSLLVVEPDAAGHQLEWLHHLIRHAAERREDSLVWLAVGPELFDELSDEARKIAGDRVRVIAMSALETRLCHTRILAVSGFARWWVTRRYARATRADGVYVLQLDHLSLPLALGLRVGGRPLNGILFRPSVHYRLLGAYRPSLRESVRDLRKMVLYRLMLLNPALASVHSLDPFFPEFAQRYFHRGSKVRTLLDPAHPLAAIARSEQRIADRIPRTRMIFLLFGYLTERKGTLTLLDALQDLAPGYDRKVAVMLAGRIDPSIKEAVLQRLSQLKRTRPDLWIGREDRRLAAGELEALIERAHVLAAPYQRFVGSSGVLMWAARAGKPVLTQDFGVMGAIVRELGLGLAVDTTSPRAIARAMREMIDAGPRAAFDSDAAMEFSARHTPAAFATAVFGTL